MRYVLFLCVVLFCGAVASADYLHVGNNNPATEGWKLITGTPGYAQEDYWVTDTYGYARWEPVVKPTVDDFLGDWMLTVEARWVAGPKAESRCTIFDGYRGFSTALTWDAGSAYYYQKTLADTPFVGVDPTQWNLYQIWYRPESQAIEFYVNGTLMDSLEPARQNVIAQDSYLLYWGDNNSQQPPNQNHSIMHWRRVEFLRDGIMPAMVPEPATVVMLLALAACGVLFWVLRRIR